MINNLGEHSQILISCRISSYRRNSDLNVKEKEGTRIHHEIEKVFLKCDGKGTTNKGKAKLKVKPQTGKRQQ